MDIGGFDGKAIGAGAVAAISLALPAQVVAQILISTNVVADSSSFLLLFALIQVLGFLVGGFAAGKRRPESALSHGALAALAGFAIVEVTSVIFIAIRGDGLIVARIVFYAMFSSLLGMIGGAVARQQRAVT